MHNLHNLVSALHVCCGTILYLQLNEKKTSYTNINKVYGSNVKLTTAQQTFNSMKYYLLHFIYDNCPYKHFKCSVKKRTLN